MPEEEDEEEDVEGDVEGDVSEVSSLESPPSIHTDAWKSVGHSELRKWQQ